MNEDALGYGHRTRKPSGYCKLTMPNKVSCYIQGLRQLPKGQMYRLYLTSKSQQKSVEVGMLQVGPGGNKETRWVMNPSNINNSGVNAQEIDGAFVMVSGDDIKGLVVPLVGFSSEPYIWEHLAKNKIDQVGPKAASVGEETTPPEKVAQKKETTPPEKVTQKKEIPVEQEQLAAAEPQNKEMQRNQTREDQLVKEPKQAPEEQPRPEPKQEPPRQDAKEVLKDMPTEPVKPAERAKEEPQPLKSSAEAEELLALREEVERLNRTIQESKAIIEEFQKQRTQAQTTSQEPSPSPQPPSEQPAYIEPLEKASNVNDYINNFIRKFQTQEKVVSKPSGVNLQNIYEKRIPINPFEAQGSGIKWVRITYDDLKSFSSLDSEWVNQPFIVESHREFKHFILGRDKSGKVYYIGIPGIFDPSKQSALSIDKIERFTCCKNVTPRAGEAGYWIGIL